MRLRHHVPPAPGRPVVPVRPMQLGPTPSRVKRPRWRRTRAASRALGRGLRRTGRAVAAYWLTVAGLASFVVAASTVTAWLGWLTAGTAILVLEWRVREGDARPPRP